MAVQPTKQTGALLLIAAISIAMLLCYIHYTETVSLSAFLPRTTKTGLPRNFPAFRKVLPKFKDYETPNTRTFHMVCLTNTINKARWSNACEETWVTKDGNYPMYCRTCEFDQKSITVYYSDENDVINLDEESSFKLIGFKLKFKHKSELPNDYTIIQNQTAYFLGHNNVPYDFYNFFHFTMQIFFPLHWLVKVTNQLHDGANNIAYYAWPYATCDGPSKVLYFDIDKYKIFRDILYIKNKLELSAYTDKPEPHQVCYKNAVFSKSFFTDKASQATDHFKDSLDVQDDVCQPKTLTIINRSLYRKIVNAEELKKAGDSLGYNTQIVVMETMSFKEQAQLIHCTNILVGVTGAGLQWAFFMKNHSSVIEIAWPYKEWYFYFTGPEWYNSGERDVVKPLKFVQLNATCELNPQAPNIYARDIYHRETNFSHEISMAIVQDERNYDARRKACTNTGKLCDAKVDVEAFKKAVIAAG